MAQIKVGMVFAGVRYKMKVYKIGKISKSWIIYLEFLGSDSKSSLPLKTLDLDVFLHYTQSEDITELYNSKVGKLLHD